jgi:hypothetical protein
MLLKKPKYILLYLIKLLISIYTSSIIFLTGSASLVTSNFAFKVDKWSVQNSNSNPYI